MFPPNESDVTETKMTSHLKVFCCMKIVNLIDFEHGAPSGVISVFSCNQLWNEKNKNNAVSTRLKKPGQYLFLYNALLKHHLWNLFVCCYCSSNTHYRWNCFFVDGTTAPSCSVILKYHFGQSIQNATITTTLIHKMTR